MQPQRSSQRLSKAKEANTSEKQPEENKKPRMNSGYLNPNFHKFEECLMNLRIDDPSVIESSLQKYNDLDYPNNSNGRANCWRSVTTYIYRLKAFHPLKISDVVAEGVLCCLEHLLIKCHVPSLDQMVVPLKNLINTALLSLSQASEEFREGTADVEESLRAFFRSQFAPAADVEASRGHIDSSKIRVEAFMTFGSLKTKLRAIYP
ncbi:ARM repeat superfamily protein [Artemisia annua]|uniref:ARM repeat superfamily protein n=1 Tax=Artemisia annua TaxID=35608 RepID=A0A2U1LZF3_ARTAN|nr:ARM repeat superfamily protein [Artemisia annua]